MAIKEQKTNVGKNSILYLCALILPKIISVFTMPILSNCLEPAEYGITNYTTNFSVFLATFSALGLNSYFLIQYAKEKDKKLLNGTLFWFLNIWDVVLLLAVGIALLFLWPIMHMSFDYWPFIPMMLITHFFNNMDLIPMRVYRMRGEVNYYLIRMIVKTILTYGLTLLFVAVLKWGVIGNYWAGLISSLVFAVFFLQYMLRHSYLKIDKKLLKDGLRFGIPLVPSGIAASGQGTITSTITEKVLTLSQLGVYAVGNSIVSVINMVIQSVSLAVEPEFYLRAGQPGYNDFVLKMKNYQLVAVGWFSVGCGVFIREAMAIMHVSQKYWESCSVVQIISIGYLVSVLTSVYTAQILLQKKTQLLLITNLGVLGVLIISELLILPIAGINGIGYATIICNLFSFIVLYFTAGRKIMHKMKLTKDFIMIGFASVTIYLTNFLNFSSTIVSIGIKVLVFAVYTAVLLSVYRISISNLLGVFLKRKKA